MLGDAANVAEDFDANRHALRKLYRYVIHDGAGQGPFSARYVLPRATGTSRRGGDGGWAAGCLKGTHDFHSFETDWPNRATSVRTITHLAVSRFRP